MTNPRRAAAKAEFAGLDPYENPSKIGNGKDTQLRVTLNANGNAAGFEEVPPDEQLQNLGKKKPKTNKRGNRWL